MLEISEFGTDDGRASKAWSANSPIAMRNSRWNPAGRNWIVSTSIFRAAPVGRVAGCRARRRRSGERFPAGPHPRCGRCTGLADRIRETGRAERRSRPPKPLPGLSDPGPARSIPVSVSRDSFSLVPGSPETQTVSQISDFPRDVHEILAPCQKCQGAIFKRAKVPRSRNSVPTSRMRHVVYWASRSPAWSGKWGGGGWGRLYEPTSHAGRGRPAIADGK